MRNKRHILVLGTLLVLVTAAFATIIISGRTLASASFRVVWNSGTDVEAITSLQWKDSPNLTGSYAVDTCNSGDVEYFGNAWAPPDPQAGGIVLVGSGTTAGTWSGTVNPVG